MTENKPPSPAMMLYEAARLAGFPARNGWPDELTTNALACLMAGEDWKSGNRADTWGDRLYDAAEAGLLLVRSEPFNTPGDPLIIVSIYTHWHYVTRAAFAAWLRTAGENPSEFVRAWLGDVWQSARLASSSASGWPAVRQAVRQAENKQTGTRRNRVLPPAQNLFPIPARIGKSGPIDGRTEYEKGIAAAKNVRSAQSKKAVTERADQKERAEFVKWGAAAVAAEMRADTVEELQSLDGFKPGWSGRDLSTLRKWAKEAGFHLKTGRPKKNK